MLSPCRRKLHNTYALCGVAAANTTASRGIPSQLKGAGGSWLWHGFANPSWLCSQIQAALQKLFRPWFVSQFGSSPPAHEGDSTFATTGWAWSAIRYPRDIQWHQKRNQRNQSEQKHIKIPQRGKPNNKFASYSKTIWGQSLCNHCVTRQDDWKALSASLSISQHLGSYRTSEYLSIAQHKTHSGRRSAGFPDVHEFGTIFSMMLLPRTRWIDREIDTEREGEREREREMGMPGMHPFPKSRYTFSDQA